MHKVHERSTKDVVFVKYIALAPKFYDLFPVLSGVTVLSAVPFEPDLRFLDIAALYPHCQSNRLQHLSNCSKAVLPSLSS